MALASVAALLNAAARWADVAAGDGGALEWGDVCLESS